MLKKGLLRLLKIEILYKKNKPKIKKRRYMKYFGYIYIQHFHGNEECNINRDLKVYILQDNVTGPRDRREYFEDRWITRLDTKAPHGMNTNLKHFAKIHYELFD